MKCKTVVVNIGHYDSFHTMLKKEGIEKVLPNVATVTHHSSLQPPYYEYIRDGIKTFELRVYDDTRRKINVGDHWIFKHASISDLPPIRTIIQEIKLYKSFDEAVRDSGFSALLPQAKSNDEAVKIYEGFDNGKYKINAEKYGVVRFKIEVINKQDFYHLPVQNPPLCPTFTYIK